MSGEARGVANLVGPLTLQQVRELVQQIADWPDESVVDLQLSDGGSTVFVRHPDQRPEHPNIVVIESITELDALPVGAIVMDSPYPDGDVYQRTSDGLWAEPGFHGMYATSSLSLPAVLLWSPGGAG